MANSNPTKRKPSGSPAAKLLITTASLTAVLGGWAVFSLQSPEANPVSQLPVSEVSLNFEPIPTVVPPPQTTASLSLAPTQPAAPQAPTQAGLPVLRKVFKPKVVTVTHSSR